MKRVNVRSLALVCAVILAAILATLTGSKQNAQEKRWKKPKEPVLQFVPGRVLVKFHDNILPAHARNMIAALGARDADEISNIGVHILDLPYQASETAFAQAFRAQPEVEFAELDLILEPDDLTPNDPWFVDQWHLQKIGGPAAWTMTTGNASVVVAILDGGVDGTHPDLAPNMVPGWNTYNNTSDTSDPGGHGTKVAGSAVAASNNSLGVAGVAWSCKIMPVRIADSTGATTYSAIASGLNWAANHGARVANVSYTASGSSTVDSSARYFQSKGGVVVVSSGNLSAFDSSPDNPFILTVSATDPNDALASFSNTGNNIDLGAPGVMIRTTARGGGYQSVAGTSFSSPIVAGVAALVISSNPSLTATQIQDILKQSADDLGAPGWDSNYGWGRVNAASAVALAGGQPMVDSTAPVVSFTSPTGGATVSGSALISISASDNVTVNSVCLSVDGVPIGVDISAPYAFTWDTRAMNNGPHMLSATASDAAGNSSSCLLTVAVSNAPADTTAPMITVVSPSGGATVSGTVSVLANTSDNVGVVKVDLYVDGVLTATSTAASFTTKWNTRKAKAGLHILQCRAFDAAGNVGLSQAVNVYR